MAQQFFVIAAFVIAVVASIEALPTDSGSHRVSSILLMFNLKNVTEGYLHTYCT